MIGAVAIVVPVNNEEHSLPSCIEAIRASVELAQRHYPEVAVVIRFALDRCSDGSAEIIEAAGFEPVNSVGPGVGAARAAAVDAALEPLGEYPDYRILIACTDADSLVPKEWVAQLITVADQHVDLIVGAVRPNHDDLDEDRRRAWDVTHAEGQARGHIHGANLAIRANFYLAVGGFAPLDEHEDVDLVSRAVAIGATLRATDESCVTTSGRLTGRTPGGYAGYLRDELIPLADSTVEEQSVA
jgi:glycosyltransferase involved in cell wall biosynthesis